MDSTTTYCDYVHTMMSDQSNLVVPMELNNSTNFSEDIITDKKAETLENLVTAVTAYLQGLPHTKVLRVVKDPVRKRNGLKSC